MQLNYSSLNQPITKQDVAAFLESRPKTYSKAIKVGWAVGFVVFTLVTIGIFSSSGSATATIIFIGAVLLVVGLALSSSRYSRRKKARMYRFALANNLKLRLDEVNPAYDGFVFSRGHSRTLHEAYSFPDGREIGSYSYETGGGKSRRTYNWGYVRIKLSRRLPHMILDAKKNNIFGKFSNLPVGLDSSQALKLEGNFNDHFTLYVPKGYGRDALYVFTPDVMMALIDAGSNYDIEVVGDTVWLYTPHVIKLDHKETIEGLVNVSSKIGTEVEDQSDYYADDRVGDRSLNAIADPGKRLRPSLRAGTVLAIICAVLYFAFSFFMPMFNR